MSKRILITGANGILGNPITKKIIELIDNNLDIEFLVAQDGLDSNPGFSDDSSKVWINQNLDDVSDTWWASIQGQYNINTILYIESIDNDGLYVPTSNDINRYQLSDKKFIKYLDEINQGSIPNLGLNVIYISTDRLYDGDEFPNELNPILIQQPEGNLYSKDMHSLEYASFKVQSEIALLKNADNPNFSLRIIRPFSIVSPRQDTSFPLTSIIDDAFWGQDLNIYLDGLRGIVFTSVDDLRDFMLSDLFNDTLSNELTSRIINFCRYKNYLPEQKLVEKIKDKLESDSNIINESDIDTIEYMMKTPQIRNMVKFYEPQIPIEFIIEEIYTKVNPIDTYQKLIITNISFITDAVGIHLVLNGTVEPLSNISILISTGNTLVTTADENGDWFIQDPEVQYYTEPMTGIAYATQPNGIQFDTVYFDIPAA